ncbi:hypothetical protein [Hymenobacter guriensis]|nr:hypothetical protein [Hymenobacter guriensis]
MRQLFLARTDLMTLEQCRLEWQRILQQLQQRPLEPALAARIADSLKQLAELGRADSPFWTATARRQKLENALIQAVQGL